MFSNDVVGAAESVCWSALAASAASASERVFGVSWEGVEEAKGKDDECDGEEARAERVLRRVVSPIVVFGCGCGCGWVSRQSQIRMAEMAGMGCVVAAFCFIRDH